MKLCLIAPLPPPYGGVANWERVIEEEIRKDNSIEVSLINIAANKRPTDGRKIFDRIFYSGYIMLRAYYLLRKQIKNNRPDVIHMTTSGGLGFYRDLLLLKLAKTKNIPTVYHVHFGRTDQYKEADGRCWNQLIKAVSLADATIVLDEKTETILREYSSKIYRVNNPINVSEIVESGKGIQEKSVISYMGWVIKAKGIEELLDAFGKFVLHNEEYELVIIGPCDENYKKYLTENFQTKNVSFKGEVEHKDAICMLAESEVLVLPSYTEGFPNVILEAMCLKKKIIATGVGAIPEMLSEQSGIVISPRDVSSLQKALDAMVHADKTDYGKNAWKRVLDKYDVKVTLKRYKEIWNTLCHNS